MTPQRAQQIWDNRLPFGELSISDAERLAVRKVWNGMPGHTCFADALLRIARGEAIAEKPAMIGTAVFTYGGEIIEQTPVYMGMPATDPVHGMNARLRKMALATLKFYPSGH